MSRIKLVLLGLVALVVVSAVASATASATVVETRYFINKVEVSAAEKISGTVGTAQLYSEVGGVRVVIICTNNKLESGEIEPKGESKGEIKFEGCGKLDEIKKGELKENANCTVKTPITFKFKDVLFAGVKSGVVEDEFKPSSGSLFVEIEVEGASCVLKGKYKVEGTYVASLPEGEIEKTEHEIVYTSTGSNITFGTATGKQASFTDTVKQVALSGANKGKTWYAGF